MLGPDKEEIDQLVEKLGKTFKIEDQGNLSDYLGIKIEKKPDGTLEWTQPTLTQSILKDLKLDGEEIKGRQNKPNIKSVPANTSVYGSSDICALAMFQRSAPTLLAYGGTYAKNADMKIENILPFAFLFGIGGPKMERRVKVSLELCIQVYMRLSLEQFMEGPTILVMNHIYNRQMTFKTGVMTCFGPPSDGPSGRTYLPRIS